MDKIQLKLFTRNQNNMFSIGLYSVQMQVHHYLQWSIVRRFQEHHLKSNATNSAYILV